MTTVLIGGKQFNILTRKVTYAPTSSNNPSLAGNISDMSLITYSRPALLNRCSKFCRKKIKDERINEICFMMIII